MRSTSGRGAQGSKRGLDDAADHGIVAEPSRGGRGGKACVGAKTGIHVDFEDEGLVLSVDTEVDSAITGKAEQAPAGERKLPEPHREFSLVALKAEAPRRADIGLAVRRPLGLIAHNLRGLRGEALENNLRDRQHLDARCPLDESEVELASLYEALSEMLSAPSGIPHLYGHGALGAAHHRAFIEAERAVLPHRLDDDARVGIEPGAIFRPGGCRQAVMSELELRADLGERVEPGAGATSSVTQAKRIEPRWDRRREPSIPIYRIDEIKHGERMKGSQALKLGEI